MKFGVNDKILQIIVQGLQVVLLGGALLYFGVYLWIACSRMNYPFELEWMEGGSLDHVRRILSGELLYVKPSIDFIPYIYTPLYFYISALAAKLLGVGFLPLRLVSFLSSLGCFGLIYLIVTQETRTPVTGVLASGLFAATFAIGGAWFDLARPDILFLGCFLAAVYLIRHKLALAYSVGAGVCVALAFLSKQTAISFAVPLALYYLLVNWRCALGFIGSIGVLVGGSTIILDAIHNGWYRYYIFHVPAQLPVTHSIWLSFWQKDIFLPLGVAVCLSILYFCLPGNEQQPQARVFYGLLAIAMVGGAWVSKVYAGGYVNNSIPAHALVCILFGLAIHVIRKWIQTATHLTRPLLQGYVFLICLIQFYALLYNPLKQIPSREDVKAGQELVTLLAEMQGEILIPAHGYLLPLAGKRSVAQEMAISNILKGREADSVKDQLYSEIQQAIRTQRFAAIILDNPWWFSSDMEQGYVRQRPVFESHTVFWPVTGYPTRPETIFVVAHSQRNDMSQHP